MKVVRKTKLVPFKVLVLLERGKHSSVQWQSQYECLITNAKFSKSVGTNTTHLRRALEWLKRYKYIQDVTCAHAVTSVTLRPLPDRTRGVEVPTAT